MAAETGIELQPGAFMAAYDANRTTGNELALEASPIGKMVIDFTAATPLWTGKAMELLGELDQLAGDRTNRSKGWPQNGRSLSGILKRLARTSGRSVWMWTSVRRGEDGRNGAVSPLDG